MNNTTLILLAAVAAFFYFSQEKENPIPVRLPPGAIPAGTNTSGDKWKLAFDIFNDLVDSGLDVFAAWQKAQQDSGAMAGCLNNRNDFIAI